MSISSTGAFGPLASGDKKRGPMHLLLAGVAGAALLLVLLLQHSQGLRNATLGLKNGLAVVAQAPWPTKWTGSNIMVLNDAPFCYFGNHAGASNMPAAGSKAGAGLAALADQQRQLQKRFCSELAAGTPNPLGTPGNETYVRVADVHAVGDASITYPMWVHDGDDIVSKHIIQNGGWERTETASVLRLLKEWKQAHPKDPTGPVLVDIGGNLGWFSLQAAVMGYRVIAFEPMPRNQGAFRRTLCENPDLAARITLVPKGLSNKPGKCQVYVRQGNLGNGFPVCEGAAFAELRNRPDFVPAGEFEVATLDDVLSRAVDDLAGRVQVIKIDVEGFEPQVFAGGRNFNARVQPRYILAELNQGYKSATSPQMLLNMYQDLGFKVHMYSFDGPLLLPKTYDSLAQTLFGPGTEHNIYMERLPRCSTS